MVEIKKGEIKLEQGENTTSAMAIAQYASYIKRIDGDHATRQANVKLYTTILFANGLLGLVAIAAVQLTKGTENASLTAVDPIGVLLILISILGTFIAAHWAVYTYQANRRSHRRNVILQEMEKKLAFKISEMDDKLRSKDYRDPRAQMKLIDWMSCGVPALFAIVYFL